MGDFFLQYWPEIVLTLITTASVAFSKYLFNQLKNYKKLLEEKDQGEITKLIQNELKPLIEQNQNLDESINKIQQTHQLQLDAIVKFFRFCLIQMCKTYLDQKYITTEQFEQLSEFYKLYHDLGGNGQGQEYYDKAMDLPVKDDYE